MMGGSPVLVCVVISGTKTFRDIGVVRFGRILSLVDGRITKERFWGRTGDLSPLLSTMHLNLSQCHHPQPKNVKKCADF